MGKQLSDWIENIVGKGEIARMEKVKRKSTMMIQERDSLWETLLLNLAGVASEKDRERGPVFFLL